MLAPSRILRLDDRTLAAFTSGCSGLVGEYRLRKSCKSVGAQFLWSDFDIYILQQ